MVIGLVGVGGVKTRFDDEITHVRPRGRSPGGKLRVVDGVDWTQFLETAANSLGEQTGNVGKTVAFWLRFE